MLKKLRALGPFGGAAADAITLLTTNWVVVASLLIGGWAAATTWAVDLIQNPRFQAGIVAFLAVLWTTIGFVFLRNQARPTSMRLFHDYAYALAFEGAQLLLAGDVPDAVMINFTFRNVGAGPIRFRVEDMRVILDGRTADHPETVGKEVIVPRVNANGYRSAPIPLDRSKKDGVRGTGEITMIYGHPDGSFERKLRVKLELGMGFENRNPVGFNAGIMSEVDSPYQDVNVPLKVL
jgi:hypothetical protein